MVKSITILHRLFEVKKAGHVPARTDVTTFIFELPVLEQQAIADLEVDRTFISSTGSIITRMR